LPPGAGAKITICGSGSSSGSGSFIFIKDVKKFHRKISWLLKNPICLLIYAFHSLFGLLTTNMLKGTIEKLFRVEEYKYLIVLQVSTDCCLGIKKICFKSKNILKIDEV
jgi:hypothetical protein